MLCVGLKHLDRLDSAGPQCRLVLRHRPVADAVDIVRVHSGAPYVVLQAQPRGRHFADRRKLDACQIRYREARFWLPADQEKGVASHDLGECYQAAIGVLVVRVQDPHWTAPRNVRLAGQQRLRRPLRIGGGFQPHVDPFRSVGIQRDGGVKGRVEHCAEIFEQGDRHTVISRVRLYPLAYATRAGSRNP